MEYSSEVLRRFDSVRAASARGRELPGSPVAGEASDRTLHVWVRFAVTADAGIIAAVQFHVFGCPHTIAAASWVADWLLGQPVEFLGRLDVGALRAGLDVPVDKLGKLLRIEDALTSCRRSLQQQDVMKER